MTKFITDTMREIFIIVDCVLIFWLIDKSVNVALQLFKWYRRTK